MFRITAALTLITFLFTSLPVDSALLGVGQAWAEKTGYAPSASGARPSSGLGEEVTRGLTIEGFSLPSYLGYVRDSYDAASTPRQARGESLPPVVIHIQDAHCNYAAQNTIARIIEYLARTYGIREVNLEGGEGEYDLSAFYRVSDQNLRRKVADHFLREGEINAAEFFAITNPGAIALWGVEETGLYLQNLTVYRDSLRYKDELDRSLQALRQVFSQLKAKVYSKGLLDLDRRASDFRERRLEFRDYVGSLAGMAKERTIDISDLKNIDILMRTLSLEKGVDFKRSNLERDQLIDRLSKTLSKNGVNELVQKAVEFKLNRLQPHDFYAYLTGKAKEVRVDLSEYKSLSLYIGYINCYSSLKREEIFKEVELLETRIKERLYENPTQRELNALSRNLDILKDLFSITLTQDEFKHYQSHRREFDIANLTRFAQQEAPKYKLSINLPDPRVINRHLEEMERFYALSYKRDEEFVKHIQFGKTIDHRPQTIDHRPETRDSSGYTVLITGGFHTENLTRLLKEKNISYISVMPNFGLDDKECPYFRLLAGNNSVILKYIMASMSKIAIYSYFCKEVNKVYGDGYLTDDDWKEIRGKWVEAVANLFEDRSAPIAFPEKETAGAIGKVLFVLGRPEDGSYPDAWKIEPVPNATLNGKEVWAVWTGEGLKRVEGGTAATRAVETQAPPEVPRASTLQPPQGRATSEPRVSTSGVLPESQEPTFASLINMLLRDEVEGVRTIITLAHGGNPAAELLLKKIADESEVYAPLLGKGVRLNALNAIVVRCRSQQSLALARWLLERVCAYLKADERLVHGDSYTDLVVSLFNNKSAPLELRMYAFGLIPEKDRDAGIRDTATALARRLLNEKKYVPTSELLPDEDIWLNEVVKAYGIAMWLVMWSGLGEVAQVLIGEEVYSAMISRIMANIRLIKQLKGAAVAYSNGLIGQTDVLSYYKTSYEFFGILAHEWGGHNLIDMVTRDRLRYVGPRKAVHELLADFAWLSFYEAFEKGGWNDAARSHLAQCVSHHETVFRGVAENSCGISRNQHEAARAALVELGRYIDSRRAGKAQEKLPSFTGFFVASLEDLEDVINLEDGAFASLILTLRNRYEAKQETTYMPRRTHDIWSDGWSVIVPRFDLVRNIIIMRASAASEGVLSQQTAAARASTSGIREGFFGRLGLGRIAAESDAVKWLETQGFDAVLREVPERERGRDRAGETPEDLRQADMALHKKASAFIVEQARRAGILNERIDTRSVRDLIEVIADELAGNVDWVYPGDLALGFKMVTGPHGRKGFVVAARDNGTKPFEKGLDNSIRSGVTMGSEGARDIHLSGRGTGLPKVHYAAVRYGGELVVEGLDRDGTRRRLVYDQPDQGPRTYRAQLDRGTLVQVTLWLGRGEPTRVSTSGAPSVPGAPPTSISIQEAARMPDFLLTEEPGALSVHAEAKVRVAANGEIVPAQEVRKEAGAAPSLQEVAEELMRDFAENGVEVLPGREHTFAIDTPLLTLVSRDARYLPAFKFLLRYEMDRQMHPEKPEEDLIYDTVGYFMRQWGDRRTIAWAFDRGNPQRIDIGDLERVLRMAAPNVALSDVERQVRVGIGKYMEDMRYALGWFEVRGGDGNRIFGSLREALIFVKMFDENQLNAIAAAANPIESKQAALQLLRARVSTPEIDEAMSPLDIARNDRAFTSGQIIRIATAPEPLARAEAAPGLYRDAKGAFSIQQIARIASSPRFRESVEAAKALLGYQGLSNRFHLPEVLFDNQRWETEAQDTPKPDFITIRSVEQINPRVVKVTAEGETVDRASGERRKVLGTFGRPWVFSYLVEWDARAKAAAVLTQQLLLPRGGEEFYFEIPRQIPSGEPSPYFRMVDSAIRIYLESHQPTKTAFQRTHISRPFIFEPQERDIFEAEVGRHPLLMAALSLPAVTYSGLRIAARVYCLARKPGIANYDAATELLSGVEVPVTDIESFAHELMHHIHATLPPEIIERLHDHFGDEGGRKPVHRPLLGKLRGLYGEDREKLISEAISFTFGYLAAGRAKIRVDDFPDFWPLGGIPIPREDVQILADFGIIPPELSPNALGFREAYITGRYFDLVRQNARKGAYYRYASAEQITEFATQPNPAERLAAVYGMRIPREEEGRLSAAGAIAVPRISTLQPLQGRAPSEPRGSTSGLQGGTTPSSFSDIRNENFAPAPRGLDYFGPVPDIIHTLLGDNVAGKTFVELGPTHNRAALIDYLRAKMAKVIAVGREVEGIPGDTYAVEQDYNEFWSGFNRESPESLDAIIARLSLYAADETQSFFAEFGERERLLLQQKGVLPWVVGLINERNFRQRYLPLARALKVGGILIRLVYDAEAASIAKLSKEQIEALGLEKVAGVAEEFTYVFPERHKDLGVDSQKLSILVLRKVGAPREDLLEPPMGEFALLEAGKEELIKGSAENIVEFIRDHPQLQFVQDDEGRWFAGSGLDKAALDARQAKERAPVAEQPRISTLQPLQGQAPSEPRGSTSGLVAESSRAVLPRSVTSDWQIPPVERISEPPHVDGSNPEVISARGVLERLKAAKTAESKIEPFSSAEGISFSQSHDLRGVNRTLRMVDGTTGSFIYFVPETTITVLNMSSVPGASFVASPLAECAGVAIRAARGNDIYCGVGHIYFSPFTMTANRKFLVEEMKRIHDTLLENGYTGIEYYVSYNPISYGTSRTKPDDIMELEREVMESCPGSAMNFHYRTYVKKDYDPDDEDSMIVDAERIVIVPKKALEKNVVHQWGAGKEAVIQGPVSPESLRASTSGAELEKIAKEMATFGKDYHAHGTNAVALRGALEFGGIILPADEVRRRGGLVLSGESGGNTPLNNVVASTVNLSYFGLGGGYVDNAIRYAESSSALEVESFGATFRVAPDTIDAQIKAAEDLIGAFRDPRVKGLEMVYTRRREELLRIREYFNSLSKAEKDELEELSKIPIVAIGHDTGEGKALLVISSVQGEDTVKQLSVTLVAVPGRHFDTVSSLLRRYGREDIRMIDMDQVEGLQERYLAYKNRPSQDSTAAPRTSTSGAVIGTAGGTIPPSAPLLQMSIDFSNPEEIPVGTELEMSGKTFRITGDFAPSYPGIKKAEDIANPREKIVIKKARDREAEFAPRLNNNTHVIAGLVADDSKGNKILIMRDIEGPTLRAYVEDLAKRDDISPQEKLRRFSKAINGLIDAFDYLAKQGFYLLEKKPDDHVLVDQATGEAVLIDFHLLAEEARPLTLDLLSLAVIIETYGALLNLPFASLDEFRRNPVGWLEGQLTTAQQIQDEFGLSREDALCAIFDHPQDTITWLRRQREQTPPAPTFRESTSGIPVPGASTVTAAAPAENALQRFNRMVDERPWLAGMEGKEAVQRALEERVVANPEEAERMLEVLSYVTGIYEPAKQVLAGTQFPQEPRVIFIPVSEEFCPINSTVAKGKFTGEWQVLRERLDRSYDFSNITVSFYDGTLANLRDKTQSVKEMLNIELSPENTFAYVSENAVAKEPGIYAAALEGKLTVMKEGLPPKEKAAYVSIGGHIVLALGILDIINAPERSDHRECIERIAGLMSAMSKKAVTPEEFEEMLKKGDLRMELPPVEKIDIEAHMDSFMMVEEAVMKSL